jgi:hypothetical protein
MYKLCIARTPIMAFGGATSGTLLTPGGNVTVDQNESVLAKAMSAYEEASSLPQKLEALRGGVVIKLALNQSGSKFLQKVLENANSQIIQCLLDEISPMLP